ncbi:MAG: glycosyltransferase [Rhodobacteraceae bacterium]|nr:glycosyltransferase [Paracoccaceae bacterium]
MDLKTLALQNVLPGRRKPADLSGTQQTPVSAFGQTVELLHPAASGEAAAALWDLSHIYERFLASRALPRAGLFADTGAGSGWTAVPFARAFPAWQVVCFEADDAAFACLQENVRRLGLENVACIHAAFHPDLPVPAELPPQRAAGSPDLPEPLRAALEAPGQAGYRRLPGLGQRLAPASAAEGGQKLTGPALPPMLLEALSPDLVKLDAPGAEQALAGALRQARTGFVMGQLFEYLPSALLRPEDPEQHREIYLPHGPHVLRRDYEDGFAARLPQLDVVVAMYNTRGYIQECVDSLLADGNPDIHVLVVDDGSTDGCGDLVEELYGSNPRVQLLRKPNGGCASARNFGRLRSRAAHIAFVDADDRVDPGMFSALLEVARYTGFNMVEAEFALLETSPEGRDSLTPSHEKELYARGADRRLGGIEYLTQPGTELMRGQPSIWRRVHRRDFLDNKNIVFPEHVRAFDDQIFQLLSAQYCGPMAHVFGHAYHYRQHPAQDIKQGDERHFYSFNMFREVFRRAQQDAWPDLRPATDSLLNTMHWSYGGLRDDLKPVYQDAAVEFLAMLDKSFGEGVLEGMDLARTGIGGLEFLLNLRLREMRDSPMDYAMVQMEDWRWQPEFIRMMQAAEAAGSGGQA